MSKAKEKKYRKTETKQALRQEINAIIKAYKNDDEINEVDIRLQLHNGNFQIWSGDSQYDTDHRGAWGSGTVLVKEKFNIADEIDSIISQAFDDL